MEARGDDDAAADRRRDDVPRSTPRSRSSPPTPRRSSTSPTRRAPWPSRDRSSIATGATPTRPAMREEYEQVRQERASRRDRETRLTLDRGARQPAAARLDRRRRPGRRSWASARSRTTRSRSSSSASTGRRSSPPGSCAAPSRRSSPTRRSGRPPATCTPTRRRAARPHRRRAPAHGVGRGRVLAGQRDARRRHRRVRRRGADHRARPPPRDPPADGEARWPAERVDRRLRGAGRRRGLRRGVRRDGGQGHDRPRGGRSRRPTTTTRRSWPGRSSDRLAEAFAERLHERVRRELWGYAPDEALSNEDIIAERYQGIRPAPGYPATPDHSAKPTLFALLDAERSAGIELTESWAMLPAASVSGLYLWHPGSHYFGIGRIGRDQLEDYARRAGVTEAEADPPPATQPRGRRDRLTVPIIWPSPRGKRPWAYRSVSHALAHSRRRRRPRPEPAGPRWAGRRFGSGRRDVEWRATRPRFRACRLRHNERTHLPGQPRPAVGLRRPGELRPVRRRERPDDAQHREAGADRTAPHAAPAPGPGPGAERADAHRASMRQRRERSRLGGEPQSPRDGRLPAGRRRHPAGGDADRDGRDPAIPAPGRPARVAGPARVGDERLRRDVRRAARRPVPASPAPTSSTRCIRTARRWGPSPTPGTSISVAAVGRQFVRRAIDRHDQHLGQVLAPMPGYAQLNGKYVMVVPIGPVPRGFN